MSSPLADATWHLTSQVVDRVRAKQRERLVDRPVRVREVLAVVAGPEQGPGFLDEPIELGVEGGRHVQSR